MATFLRTKDGNSYINVDFIELVNVNNEKGIAYLHTTAHRNHDWKGVYEIPAAEWLRHIATFDTPEVTEETPDNHLTEHRGSAPEVGAARKTPDVKTKSK